MDRTQVLQRCARTVYSHGCTSGSGFEVGSLLVSLIVFMAVCLGVLATAPCEKSLSAAQATQQSDALGFLSRWGLCALGVGLVLLAGVALHWCRPQTAEDCEPRVIDGSLHKLARGRFPPVATARCVLTLVTHEELKWAVAANEHCSGVRLTTDGAFLHVLVEPSPDLAALLQRNQASVVWMWKLMWALAVCIACIGRFPVRVTRGRAAVSAQPKAKLP